MSQLEQIEEELSSAHSGITALPRLESIYNPKRARTRIGSGEPVFEEDLFEKDVGVQRGGDRSGAKSPVEMNEDARHHRMLVWLIAVFIAVLVLAIVLGAVLGTFVSSKHKSSPQPSITEIPASTTPTPTPTGGVPPSEPTAMPLHIQSLTVTGWSYPDSSEHYSVTLFSQGTDGYLSRHSFDSTTGNWTRVSDFVAAKSGTPLTASSLNAEYYAGQPNYSFGNTHYQSQVVYLNNDNDINEWIFPDSGPELGQPGSLTQQMYIAHPETQLAFYWPSLIYQGMSGEVREAQFQCYQEGECWNEHVLHTSEAANGTKLVTVPRGNNLTSMSLFYREDGGRFVDHKEDDGNSQIYANEAFSSLIPTDSAVTAFSSRRPGDAQALNTYLLWQNESGTVQMSWSDNENGWRAPVTDQAFNGAEKNTAIACLTGLTFSGFPLAQGTELSRCYFQAGAAVREVSFDGNAWRVVGNVPTFGF
ncbi:hypothetical protein K491DRAFT_697435 [Lophiostoma macrostomum CBS 122681]|uniref:Fucose-specific lectin n=1 Tax=Lophiostoma macrostomum CBS 122681 TaxID=1314788 RepID=A0A6A6SUX5_9PLEO|nr:hypothetical protein K491DRAFT_697435 [Lophiostoma macrostomum CBS 122681]